MQELKEIKTKVVQGLGKNVPAAPVSEKRPAFFRIFSSSASSSGSHTSANVSKAHGAKIFSPRIVKSDPAAVRSWVALEEKIVHDYQEQKSFSAKSRIALPGALLASSAAQPSSVGADRKTSLPGKTGAVPRFWSFGGLFKAREERNNKKKTHIVLKKPVVGTRRCFGVSMDRRQTINNFIALEEKIIHHYHKQNDKPSGSKNSKPPVFKQPVRVAEKVRSLPEASFSASSKELLPDARQVFSSHTGIVSSRVLPGRETSRHYEHGKSFRPTGLLAFAGWIAAGLLMLLYSQSADLNREFSKKLSQVQAEKEQINVSHDKLKDLSHQQMIEMKWLNGQLGDMALELKKAKTEKEAFQKNLEKQYREQLSRHHENSASEITALKAAIQTQNAVLSALKAQNQALSRILDQAGMVAVSGVAAELSQGNFPGDETPAFRGHINSIDMRRGSVLIGIGEMQGVKSGRGITVFRHGVELAQGYIDRVYPTMSVALVPNIAMLKMLREGDIVVLS